MAIQDLVGEAFNQRISGATDRFNQALGLVSGDEDAYRRQFGLETEEERRRRLEREAAEQAARAAAEQQANAVVSSTKIETYGDGSQTRTV